MLRAILAAMKNVFRAGIGIILWPFTWFSGGSRRQHSGIDMGAVKAVEDQVAATKKPASESLSSLLCVNDAKRDAQIAWSWVATSLLTEKTGPFPSALSKKMSAWLKGLDHRQLTALRNAGADGVLAHSIGKNTITGVPAVRPMSPVTVKFPRIAATKPDAEISDFEWSPT